MVCTAIDFYVRVRAHGMGTLPPESVLGTTQAVTLN